MKLGLITVPTDTALSFARDMGIQTVQLPIGAGTPLDIVAMSSDERSGVMDLLAKYGLGLSAFGFFDNLLDQDTKTQHAAVDYAVAAVDAAAEMGAPILSVFGGRDKSLAVSENIPKFKEAFSMIVGAAEKAGVKIAMENCAMIDRHLQMHVNMACSPELWDKLFEAVPSDKLGLEYDPSHFIGLHIDYLAAFSDFSDKVFHIHGKDMEILPEKLGRSGVFGTFSTIPGEFASGCDRFRAPGWGAVDWRKLMTLVIEAGYNGSITIENEDPIFSNPFEPKVAVNGYTVAEHFGTQNEAIRQSCEFLRPLMPL